jgi:hypothetical protein
MKRDVGWGASMAVAVAAVLGVSQFGGRAPQGTPELARTQTEAGSHKTKSPTKSKLNPGICDDLEKRLQAFFGVLDEDSILAPGSCTADGRPAFPKIKWRSARSLSYVIATMDDPVYTHFALGFDRKAEAIQQAAADAGYVYDSSWLPWDPEEKNFQYLNDQDKADERKNAREEQPGVLLFRKALSDVSETDADAAYREGLAVFVVGDDPTDGIHRAQFQNATAWIAALKHQGDRDTPHYELPKAILGPSFSGSLPSLAALLNDIPLGATRGQRIDIPIYSGEVTSGSAVGWFERATKDKFNLRFASFQSEDSHALRLYCRYLETSGFHLENLAIVSEDETAFGANSSGYCEQNGAVDIYYPRDISALRGAYQKQSLFGSGNATPATNPRRTLAPDLADPESQEHDTIRTFSGGQTALSQEAVLQQIVSFLRANQSQYIVLRSSNPLDQLFLSHYLRLAYPQGRIVILGADLLLRRERGASRLSGLMTLSNYPLYPWGPEWIQDGQQRRDSNIHPFPEEGMEGTYVAMRYLLRFQEACVRIDKNSKIDFAGIDQLVSSGYRFEASGQTIKITSPLAEISPDEPDETYTRKVTLTTDTSTYVIKDYREDDPRTPAAVRGSPLGFYPQFLPVDPEFKIPDYNTPFWLRSSGGAPTIEAPPLWLSVLGADDFWPVAALSDQTDEVNQAKSQPCMACAWIFARGTNALESNLRLAHEIFIQQDINSKPWPPIPGSMRFAILCLAAWVVFHSFCCWLPSVTQKPNYRAYFVTSRMRAGAYSRLMIVGSLALSSAATVLAWGYGTFSPEGQPFESAHADVLPLLVLWIGVGVSLFANLWKVRRQVENDGWAPPFPVDLGRPVLLYFIGTLAFYSIFYVCGEAPMTVADRFPTYWRAMHMASGVSPLILLIAPFAGIYMWFWYALQRLALSGPSRPRLPRLRNLAIVFEGKKRKWLDMFSIERVGYPVEREVDPAPKKSRILIVFIVLWIAARFAANGIPIRTLAGTPASIFVCFVMGACVTVLLVTAWRLFSAWISLRQLLAFLYRTRLRRSMAAIPGVSWGSVWKISGNVLDMRDKLLSSQFECSLHLENSLKTLKDYWPLPRTSPRFDEVFKAFSSIQEARRGFANWYSKQFDQTNAHDEIRLKNLQETFARAAGVFMTQLLLPAWREEEGPEPVASSLDAGKQLAPQEETLLKSVAKLEPRIRFAEQFVCLVYLAFIQNTLAQIRSFVLGILWLFVAITVAMASYPFDPRPAISGAILLLFLVLGCAVATVYAQMYRDPILSLITNTAPGELGGDFWIKLAGFAAGPLLGLIATLFPQIADFVYSWVQPSVSSMK